MRLLRNRLRDLWRSLFWKDPYPDFQFEFWASEDPTELAMEREEYEEALADYLSERARVGPYR